MVNQYQKVVPFIMFILALGLLFNLIKPLITILLSSILIAYISFPLYKKVSKKVHYEPISIILSLFIIAVIILIPFIFLAFEITQQGYYFYHSLPFLYYFPFFNLSLTCLTFVIWWLFGCYLVVIWLIIS